MQLIDEYIRTKFLEHIAIIFEKYNIEKSIYTPRGNLLTRILENNFCEEFFKIYIEHYKRNFIVLEALAIKQNLDIERQVFNLVREHININNTTLTISHLTNLYNSYKEKRIVNTPEKLAKAGVNIKLEKPEIKFYVCTRQLSERPIFR